MTEGSDSTSTDAFYIDRILSHFHRWNLRLSAIFTRPILWMGRVYKLKSCVSVITPTFPLKTLLNYFRCFTDQKTMSGGCLVVFGGVWSMSGGVWWCLMHVWWCPAMSMYIDRFELIDVYGQISLPVHLTDAAKMLMLLMR